MASYSSPNPVVARRLLSQRFAAGLVFLLAAFAALSSAESSAAEKKSEKIVADFFAERMLLPHTIDKVWPAAPSRGAMLWRGENEWDEIENDGELVRVLVTIRPEADGKLITANSKPKPIKFDITCLVFDGEVILHMDSSAVRLANEQMATWKRRTGGQIPAGVASVGHLHLKPTESQLAGFINHLRETEPWLNERERHEKALKMYYGQNSFVSWLQDIAAGRWGN